jgi:starch phosphorylase
MWLDWEILIGVPHDMLMVGYGGSTVNTLRLYSARASDEFDMQIFNRGDYIRAVERKVASETVSKVLYPADDIEAGRELRLIQEYFFVACALRDIIRRYRQDHSDMADFGRKVAIQLNDTHPALAVAELMRTLVDENQFPWEKAWQITRQTTAYTNHTLLSEALERWPVDLIERVLPRHMQIIFEINRRFLDRVQELRPGDDDRRARMSLIEEGAVKQVRMAHLALVGSHSVNGVAALHSELVKSSLFPDFYDLWPHKFSNKTNGITPRRWLLKANPELSGLISRHIGEAWITDLNRLRALEPLAGDAGFRADFDRIKARNKQGLARIIFETTRVRVDPQSLFDVQAKRIHEYKRQLLMVMGIIDRYLGIVDRGEFPETARTCVFAGKAAPGYAAAKLIIKLINSVAEVINRDARVKGLLKVAFVPDYRVSLAEKIIPAADLSEQISTAGKEASGTGNMKFALNGALTVGTMDGANIEILEEVGRDNIFIFGLHADQVAEMRRGSYAPREFYNGDERLRSVVDAIASDRFCAAEPGLFRPLWDTLLNGGDPYFHLADFAAYVQIQETIDGCYRDRDGWIEKAVLNVACMGKFSSDRTIAQYAQDIWQVEPVLPTG